MEFRFIKKIFFCVIITCLPVFMPFRDAVFGEEKAALRMATTTSTANTGILKMLVPAFKKDAGIEVRYMAVGTGKALELGRKCSVDVLMVHAPEAEKKYVKNGFGKDRRLVMYNDFIVIGPKKDPAKVKGLSIAETMRVIAEKKASFVSRGDNSGTHKKEMSLWKTAGLPIPDKANWYVRTGKGMIRTIAAANARGAYTLADRGTYIRYKSQRKGNLSVVILTEGDTLLLNQYSVMAVNPARCDNVRHDLALEFMDWIISDPVQKLIGDFRLLGKQVYTPNAR